MAFCFWNFIRKDRMTKDGNKLVREICALLFACALALITLAQSLREWFESPND